jgi:hypothetical protein
MAVCAMAVLPAASVVASSATRAMREKPKGRKDNIMEELLGWM